jgi:DNA-binding NarL/FixJ family response regulator
VNEIRVLLIEDNPFLRKGIEALINRQSDIKVIKAVADFENASTSLSEFKSSVVLLDLSLHDQNSLSLTKKLSRETCGHVIIIIDAFSLKEEIDRYLKAGASGFIDRDSTPDEYLEIIRKVAGGARVLPNQLLRPLFSRIVEYAAQSGTVRPDEPAVKITGRERKIIELVGEGMNNKDIAYKLKISLGKVRCHKDSIMKKLALRKALLSEGS